MKPLYTDTQDFEKSTSYSRTSFKTPNPTLGTIRMVENTLLEMEEYPTKNKLWRKLPRQVQYPIFKEILKYLEESKKIMYDTDNAIIWTFVNTPELEQLKADTKSFE